MAIGESESIRWISVLDELPDAGVAVLLYHPEESEPVWPGAFEGCTADGFLFTTCSGNPLQSAVTHWAELPTGPVTIGKMVGVD